MRTVEQFLEDLFGSQDAKIRFRVIGDMKPKKLCGKYSQLKDKLLEYNTKDGYNIYFVVNSGGDSDDEINKINSVYIDFDCGRDENKEYYSMDIVDKYKKEKIGVLNDSNHFCVPSYIIETRNGLHAYWLLNEDISIGEFKTIQCDLIDLFGSDRAVKNPSRIMRLPDYEWTKDLNNRFMSKVIQYTNVRYGMEDFRVSRGSDKTIISNLSTVSTPSSLSTSDRKISHGTVGIDVIQMIKSKNSELLKKHFNFDKFIAENNNEYMDYITSIDIGEVLNIPYSKSFCCLFHSETKPSASIFKTDNGSYMYKCHSSSCGVNYNLLHIIERLGKFNSRSKTHRFIKEIFNIEVMKNEWQQEQIENLRYNVEYVTLELQKQNPELYSKLRHHIDYYVKLNLIAEKFVLSEKFVDKEGNPVFFLDTKNILKECGYSEKQDKRIINKNVFLSYHNLLNKLDDSEIPEILLKKSKFETVKKNKSNNDKHLRVNYYSIPCCTVDNMIICNEQSIKWKDYNYTIKGMSREMFYRKEGKEVADKLYPQHKKIKNEIGIVDRTTSEKQDELQSIITNIINDCMSTYGYFKDDFMNQFNIIGKDGETAIGKEAKLILLKKNIPDLLDMYGWKKVRANKELKEKLNIKSKGSPRVIVSQDLLES
jgi:hypothetical protein